MALLTWHEWLKLKESRPSKRAKQHWEKFADPEKSDEFFPGNVHGGETGSKELVDKVKKLDKKTKKKSSKKKKRRLSESKDPFSVNHLIDAWLAEVGGLKSDLLTLADKSAEHEDDIDSDKPHDDSEKDQDTEDLSKPDDFEDIDSDDSLLDDGDDDGDDLGL